MQPSSRASLAAASPTSPPAAPAPAAELAAAALALRRAGPAIRGHFRKSATTAATPAPPAAALAALVDVPSAGGSAGLLLSPATMMAAPTPPTVAVAAGASAGSLLPPAATAATSTPPAAALAALDVVPSADASDRLLLSPATMASASLPLMPTGFAPAAIPGPTPEILRVGMLQPGTHRPTLRLVPDGSNGLTSGELLLQHGPSATDLRLLGPATGQPISWSSLAAEDEDEDEDDEELVPRTPTSAAKCSVPPTRPCVVHETEACGGWRKVLPRRGPRHSTLSAPVVAPRPLPAWLHGRCCRCLFHGHRAADCRDPFMCSRCLENGHRARGCRNAWRPLSLLASLAASPLTCPVAEHREAPAPCQAQIEAPILPKTFRRDSWASIVSAPVASVAMADVSLRSTMEGQAELLRSELLNMASFRLEETVQPLRDVIDSMKGWMLQMGNFLERAEAVLSGLLQVSPVLQTAPMQHPLIVPDVNLEDENGDGLHGRFSPRAGVGSPLSASEGSCIDVVVAPVLQIMPELLELCGESTPPLSVEQLKVDPLESSVVALPPLPPLEPSQMLDSEKGDSDVAMSCSSVSIGQVVPVGDMVVAPRALARVPGALIAKEICHFLATLDAANPGSGKTIGCLLKEKAIRDKKSGGASSRPVVLKEKSNKCRTKKSGAIEKASVIA
ncbi:hypothetical protein VPH35_032508 [Triticum aestivum]